MPAQADGGPASPQYPVAFDVQPQLGGRNRLTVGFRFILAIPQALLVGGPDGLDATLKASADETLRLSDLTLPHAFARVLLAEALYRGWTVMVNHPYHRE